MSTQSPTRVHEFMCTQNLLFEIFNLFRELKKLRKIFMDNLKLSVMVDQVQLQSYVKKSSRGQG